MDLQPLFPDNNVCLREEDPDSKTWRILNVDYASLNYLRRWLKTETVSVAFDWFLIRFNNTSISNEVVSQRLGLIPIEFDPLNLEPFEEEISPEQSKRTIQRKDVQLCSERTCLVFQADVYNQTNEMMDLTTERFEWVPLGNQAEIFQLNPPKLMKRILLARLYPGQRLAFKVYAFRGTGSQHIKWSRLNAFYNRPDLLPVRRGSEPVETQLSIASPYYDPRFEESNKSVVRFFRQTGQDIPEKYPRGYLENLSLEQLEPFTQVFSLPPAHLPNVRKRIFRILELLDALEPLPEQPTIPEVQETGCVSCEKLPESVKSQLGFNCYYFTIDLNGGLTFEQVQEQLETRFEWPPEFTPVDRVQHPVQVGYIRPTRQ